MVKYILLLSCACSLLLQAQCAKLSQNAALDAIPAHSSRSLDDENSFSSVNPASATTITSPGYIIQPLSTIHSILPSEEYASHTIRRKSKEKRSLSQTSITAEATPTPINKTLEVLGSLSSTSTFTSIDSRSSVNASNAVSTNEPNSSIQSVVVNSVNPAPASTIIGSSSDSATLSSALPTTAIISSSVAPKSSTYTSNSLSVDTTPAMDESLSAPSIPDARDIIKQQVIASINNEVLKGMPSRSLTLQKPTLPSHSVNNMHNNKMSSNSMPTHTHSSNRESIASLHAAQLDRQKSFISIPSTIPSILKTPQQIEQQRASSMGIAAITSIVSQKITDTPKVSQTPASNNTQTIVKVIAQEVADPEAQMKACYRRGRKVEFSQYWIPKENEWDETNKGKRVFLGGDAKMKLYDRNDKEIGMVPIEMYQKCRMEGTCLLENGDLINIEANDTDTFIKIGGTGRQQNVFGLGSGPQNLVPFVSVAANDIPYGQKLYISALDGVDLGYGMKHNGCVRVDDESWSFDSCQIDFFVVTYVDYLWLDLDTSVSIKYADCKLQNYVTRHHLAFVKASTDRKIIPQLLDAKSTFFDNKNL